ncbi:MAG TPA: amidohydrolase [Bacillota bacterium]|nr:amidohydrolase [Bacillota bacterium]HOQ02425.1 amidohydrolase [Bacillota bacterium]HPV12937.1 amidohydrolase [Bacillota bacterium]HPZ77494.1 amidohydrolase [Bacillota bacterium]HQD73899.1 amidohydrolase [Bacillota bacterium]
MLAITNCKIYPVDREVIGKGTILIENGKIVDVGSDITIPPNAQVIDASGKLAFPGFIDAHSHLGLNESCIGFEGSDVNESTDPVTPNMRAIDGFNPLDVTVKEARESGVTSCAVGPGSANVVGGTFMAVKTFGTRVDNMVIKDPVAMKVAFGENPKRVYSNKGKTPSTRMGTAAILREILAKTMRYNEQLEAAAEDPSKKPGYDAKLEAMLPVIKGEIPLKAHAHRSDDIFTAIRIAKEFNIRITLDHCTDGALIAEEIAKEGFPAIVGPSFGHRSKFELTNKSFVTPGVLAKAGVKVAITTDSPVTPLHSLPLMAGMAVSAGMEHDDALRAITLNPAEIIGIDSRVGSITPGKDADIVIFQGHPFEISSKPWMILIDGINVLE